jgi:hypothetical protein
MTIATFTAAPAALGSRPTFSLTFLTKSVVNRLVAGRVASVERELRRLGREPANLDAADFLPFKL